MYRVSYLSGNDESDIMSIHHQEQIHTEWKLVTDKDIQDKIEDKIKNILAKYKTNPKKYMGEVFLTDSITYISGSVECIG